MSMTRTTVYLSRDAKQRLSLAARRRHRSEAELIRDAIDRLLAEEPERPKPNPPALDMAPSVADDVDAHLSAGFGEHGLEGDWWRA
ncbi:CopG family transcriptional regulator [Actinocrinis puniceicyclus]|uniref:CopG family transcriptional regulator n=1 Tax=Actinocrinis puniceicyclus TaxID=977794 RepID=A0A8J8BAX9_9ACTN|nr:CopG family transcriptional regulator [Actinocrinis puniceicyclus]MBS2962528.1 CopG family transcriptional regulator [Actinocrinis puniceicyclus]